jgi:hypothetical protein
MLLRPPTALFVDRQASLDATHFDFVSVTTNRKIVHDCRSARRGPLADFQHKSIANYR